MRDSSCQLRRKVRGMESKLLCRYVLAGERALQLVAPNDIASMTTSGHLNDGLLDDTSRRSPVHQRCVLGDGGDLDLTPHHGSGGTSDDQTADTTYSGGIGNPVRLYVLPNLPNRLVVLFELRKPCSVLVEHPCSPR